MIFHKRPTYQAHNLAPRYRLGPRYDLAGATQFVYERSMTDPQISILGNGFQVAGGMRIISNGIPASIPFGLPQTTIKGRGFQTGQQFFTQPLI